MSDRVTERPAFGAWLAAADGRAHYRRGAGFVCGSGAAATGAAVWRDRPFLKILVPYCPACRRRVIARWAAAAAPEPPEPPAEGGAS
jgi:hypothetical protein